ncbi:alkaline phosphatase D family protein [Ramlibacter sp. USB13]|uniref:Alkaline phosphatase D family protein n=1 Tax=Ramlibacter cellulosilyticus TaxID=2764187 RepID=A0A923MV82_9BURK|nr:alkaline phosphatase D family protein [Ramlibacter cellulosilyticus]MBC5786020.1 alkaline phosphatase D family protein [Ramlibacter cellulosilyticus]
MEPLWKLPPYELSPTADGGWAVQSEEGFGEALAVFAPLYRDGEWRLAMADDDVLALTGVDDRGWTPVRLPVVERATHYLCILRYDHPADHPSSTWFRLQVPGTHGPRQARGPVVAGSELRRGLERVREHLRERFELYLVPAAAQPAAILRGSADAVSFAFASCQYPAGLLDRPVAHRSYQRLAASLQPEGAAMPERLLLLGDQVYTDATYGLVDPARIDDRYRIPYEDFADRENGPFASLPQTLLALRRMTPDDHEIRDNWEPTPGADPVRDAALEAFWKYQRRAPAARQVWLTEEGPGWRLFVTDSRTQRSPRDEDTLHEALILGRHQTDALHDWLRAPDDGRLKVVSSAAMLLPRTRMNLDAPLYLDAWQGYPASLHGLLALLCEHEVHNVVFLSGDAHIACDARVQVTRPGTGKHASFASLHAPALYAPYPFANEEEANLLLQDSFAFGHGGATYHCTVSAQVLADGANGCGLLRASRHGARWCVAYEVL